MRSQERYALTTPIARLTTAPRACTSYQYCGVYCKSGRTSDVEALATRLQNLSVLQLVSERLLTCRAQVQDISGGCGSMYAIQIESPKFKGLTVIKQHKMVNEVLKDEIKSWHGVQLRTKAA